MFLGTVVKKSGIGFVNRTVAGDKTAGNGGYRASGL